MTMEDIPIFVTVSEPWDVGEAVKWQRIKGHLLRIEPDSHGGRALVEFDPPITYRGALYRYAIASPRLEGHQIVELSQGKLLCSSLTGISDQQAQSDNPLDTSNWRGGLAFLGDIEVSQ